MKVPINFTETASSLCSNLCDTAEGLAWDADAEGNTSARDAALDFLRLARAALVPLHDDEEVAAEFLAAVFVAVSDAAASGSEELRDRRGGYPDFHGRPTTTIGG